MDSSMMNSFSNNRNLPDLSFLTDSERNKIIEVLNRDEHVQKNQIEICL
jgi:hypothetical protein